MRAIIEANPEQGPGYGIIKIYDITDAIGPMIVIRRMSDGLTLAQGGWKEGENSLKPQRWENNEDCLKLWLDPDLIDDLSKNEHYELEIPGIGTCPLEYGTIFQSRIIEENGAGAWPPPPQSPIYPSQSTPYNTVYEGVEQTPEILPDAESGTVSGVASGPDNAKVDKQPKRRGCVVFAMLLTVVWLAGGWLLWHAAMNTPVISDEEKSAPFSFIPDSDDASEDRENSPLNGDGKS